MADKILYNVDARDALALSRTAIDLSSINHQEGANSTYDNALRDINAIALAGRPIATTQGALRQVNRYIGIREDLGTSVQPPHFNSGCAGSLRYTSQDLNNHSYFGGP